VGARPNFLALVAVFSLCANASGAAGGIIRGQVALGHPAARARRHSTATARHVKVTNLGRERNLSQGIGQEVLHGPAVVVQAGYSPAVVPVAPVGTHGSDGVLFGHEAISGIL